jgi:hypothetical protein
VTPQERGVFVDLALSRCTAKRLPVDQGLCEFQPTMTFAQMGQRGVCQRIACATEMLAAVTG